MAVAATGIQRRSAVLADVRPIRKRVGSGRTEWLVAIGPTGQVFVRGEQCPRTKEWAMTTAAWGIAPLTQCTASTDNGEDAGGQ